MHRTSSTSRAGALDEGITLIEVMVAILVFAIIASGLVAGMITIIRVTADARSRIVATNLATEQLDQARVKNDPFQVSGQPSTPTTVDGRTFYVTRSVKWVSAAGGDLECNSSTTLFYLRVNVRVRWNGQLTSTPDVQSDTLIAPSSRVTDASTGAISVSVVGADGITPQQSVTVTITPKSGGTGKTLTVAPTPTTAAGCTYATQVTPGVYTVKINKAGGYVGSDQATSPQQEITVAAGSTVAAPFQYDLAANYTLLPVTAGVDGLSPLLPSGLQATFINSTSGQYQATFAATPIKLHPYSSYGIVGGIMANNGCQAVDPAAWNAGTSSGVPLAAGVRATGGAAAGGNATVQVPLGAVEITASAGTALKAIRSLSGVGAGNPGCAHANTTYNWTATGAKTLVALPFGSWTIYAGNVAVSAANLKTPTNAAGPLSGVFTGGVVTLDPRRAA